AIGRDTVQVTVNAAGNQAPTANAGADKTITLPTNSVSVTGTGTDPGGSIASYAWTKVSGPTGGTIATATAATTSITALIQGVYKFELKVTDNLGAIGRDTVQVTVNAAGNQAPIANAGADMIITLPTSTFSLAGTGTDADGTIIAYSWSRIAGPSAVTVASPNSATTLVSGFVQGVYKFEFRVTDNLGIIVRDTMQVTVNAAATANNAYGGVRWAIPGTVQAENYDVGGQNSAYNDATTANDGAGYRLTEAVDITTCSEGGYLVGWSVDGEWLKYSVNVTTTGTYSLEARIACTAAGKSFRVEMDGTTIATVTPPVTGAIQNWQTVTIPNLHLTAGNKIMRIYWITAWGVNINYLKFNLTTAGARMAKIPEVKEAAVDAGTTVTTFPLPFSTSFTVNIAGETKGEYNLTLVDVSGKTVWKKTVTKSSDAFTENIYMGNLPNGVYVLQVVTPEKKQSAYQLIKN
ncbi:MAG: carbohydrate-binding protein, partial [Ferruginibacter sp.]